MTGPKFAPARSVDELIALYERWGKDHYDEHVSQLAHARQTAALAAADTAPPELVAAALLHDVGHLLHLAAQARSGHPADPDGPGAIGGRDWAHEAIGARYLSRLFPVEVTGPIALHVQAKRYRCAVEPAYQDQLSEGSVQSLARQGGPMGAAEVAAFERLAGHEGALLVRAWDDRAKVDGLAVSSFDYFADLLDEVVAEYSSRSTPMRSTRDFDRI